MSELDPISPILFTAGRDIGTAMLSMQDKTREALFNPVMAAIRAAYNLGYADGCRETVQGQEAAE